MQDLRLIGVHEDGQHLLLGASDGEHFLLPIDDPLRAAIRRDRPTQGRLELDVPGGMRPRDVQALIRSGASAEEAAERAGWSVEKVRKFEGPILAERVHIADQAKLVRLRRRGGPTGTATPTLAARVLQRMRERDVNPDTSEWDSWRSPDGRWSVVVRFAAGGRERLATWEFDPVLRTVEASDDEARWLSADEPESAGPLGSTERAAVVYDVEAEGGVSAGARRIRSEEPAPVHSSITFDPPAAPAAAAGSAAASRAGDEPVDLMSAMRARTTVSGRRRGGRRARHTEPPLPLEEPVEHPDPVQDPQGIATGAGPTSEAVPEGATGNNPVESANGPAEGTVGAEPSSPRWAEPAELEDFADITEAGDSPAEQAGASTLDQTDATAETPEGPSRLTQAEDVQGTTVSAAEREDAGEAVEQEATGEAAVPDNAEPGVGAPKAKPARRGGRPSVPSWDDIMFGSRRD